MPAAGLLDLEADGERERDLAPPLGTPPLPFGFHGVGTVARPRGRPSSSDAVAAKRTDPGLLTLASVLPDKEAQIEAPEVI